MPLAGGKRRYLMPRGVSRAASNPSRRVFSFSTFRPSAGRISLPAGQFHRAKRDFTRPQDEFRCREPGASGSAVPLPRRGGGLSPGAPDRVVVVFRDDFCV